MLLKKEIMPGVTTSFIRCEGFKTTVISVSFIINTKLEFVESNAVLPFVLASGCPRYPKMRDLREALDMLFGASVVAVCEKHGDTTVMRLVMSVLSDEFSEPGNLKNAAKLLMKLIFERLDEKCIFSENEVEREKRLAQERIMAQLNNKRGYARRRCEEEMGCGEPFGLSVNGTVEETAKINVSHIQSAYKRALSSAEIELRVLGSCEPQELFELFGSSLCKIDRCFAGIDSDIIKTPVETKSVCDKMDIAQSKLVLGFRTNKGGGDNDTLAELLACDIFGGGTYSRLFTVVREELNLCYYCSARPLRRKGMMFVECGVEAQNIEQAKSSILDQLEYIKAGKFTEEELDTAKRSVSDAIMAAQGNILDLDYWYNQRGFERSPLSPSQICERLSYVQKQDIIDAASRYQLDTIYTLQPTVKEENK